MSTGCSPRCPSLLAAAGTLVGVLIAAWDGWGGNMYRLEVLAEHRHRGVGLARARWRGVSAPAGRLPHHGLGGYEDEIASAFWESAGYPRGHQDRPPRARPVAGQGRLRSVPRCPRSARPAGLCGRTASQPDLDP